MENDLGYFKNMLRDLDRAVFYNNSQSFLKYPNCLIELAGTDENGRLYFWMVRPRIDISGYEESFPAQLQFYNKEVSYYAVVEGIVQKVDQVINKTFLVGNRSVPEKSILFCLRVHNAHLYMRNYKANRYAKSYMVNLLRKINKETISIFHKKRLEGPLIHFQNSNG